MSDKNEFIEDLDIDIMGIIVDSWKPKNGKQAIIKGTNGKQIVIKGIDLRGLLFATVVAAGGKDLDGQEITNEEVEKSCHNYMLKTIEKGFKADLNHDKKELEGVKLVENFVNRSTDNYSHDIVIDFKSNKTLMEKAVDSSIHGVSPAGHARIVEKGVWEKAFDKVIGLVKGTKTDFEKENERSKMWLAFDMFRRNVAKWEYDPALGYNEERILLAKEEFHAQVDELADVLKNIDVEKINKGEPDMKKELQDFVATDEGKKELEILGYVQKAQPETTKETLEKAEPAAAPVAISKAEFDAYKADADKQINDLKTQLIEVAKGRATGADELAPVIDLDSMSDEQLKTLRTTQPEVYQAALKTAVAKRK